ncbi:MAG: hypothetical protein PVI30_17220 [Myxococcales bacterium]
MGSTRCPAEEAPLTAAVGEAFELDALAGFLEDGPHRLQGGFVGDAVPADADGGPVDVELRFELGDFVYYETTSELDPGNCDSVRAPAQVEVALGDGLMTFTATGVIRKELGRLEAIFYADADLPQATGSFMPELDDSRPHTGEIEVSLRVFPQAVRGEVIAAALYFESEEALQVYLDDGPWGDRDRETLLRLELPVDDCEDSSLPLATGEAADVLGGRSPQTLWQTAAMRIDEAGEFDAVWKDGGETSLTVQLDGVGDGSACAESVQAPTDLGFEGVELHVHVPTAGRLRTGDDTIDVPLSEVILALGADDLELRRARVRAVVERDDAAMAQGTAGSWEGDRLDGWVVYSFVDSETRADGLVELQEATGDSSWSPIDCLALPPGGEWDTGHCRYMR